MAETVKRKVAMALAGGALFFLGILAGLGSAAMLTSPGRELEAGILTGGGAIAACVGILMAAKAGE